MGKGILRTLDAIHRAVVGSESWSAAWELLKAELAPSQPTLVGYALGALTMIGTLATDVGWVGVAALTFALFVAGRQFVIQRQVLGSANGTVAGRNESSAPEQASPIMDATNASHFPSGLYVGSMHVDAQHLSREFYLDIAIQGFNATGEAISITEALGAITFCGQANGGSGSDKLKLPPATILHERGLSRLVANLGEIFVVVSQRVPREIAERASALLGEGNQIEIAFEGWNLVAQVANDANRRARLPLWDGVTLGVYPDRIATEKIATGYAQISLEARVD